MPKDWMEDRIKSRLERQIEGLHGNEALTSDLDDNSAGEFLTWAEDKVRKIVDTTADMDDETAEEAMYPRLKAVRRMARYINRAAGGPVDEAGTLEKILQQAREIYGDGFREPDSQQMEALRGVLKREPAVLIKTLKNILEGEQDDEPQEREQ